MVVTERPIRTGSIFLLASSNGSTLQVAATGMRAQGTSVPPPTQMPAICPRAVRVATPVPMLSANKFATEPASEIPENPEPSSPVMAPATINVTAPTALDRGTTAARDAPRSFTSPWRYKEYLCFFIGDDTKESFIQV
jgi:hypothetical protein